MKRIDKILSAVLSVVMLLFIVTSVGLPIVVDAETSADEYGYFSYTIANNEVTITSYSLWDEDVELIIPSEINGYPVTTLGQRSFGYHDNIKSIYIPESVIDLYDAFYFCSSIESITVNESNTKYHSNDNCLIETESKKLILGCKNSIIPDDGSVTSIGNDAFTNCTGLSNIDIPNTIHEIYPFAFSYCKNLTSVYIPDSVSWISDGSVFVMCDNLTTITVNKHNPFYHSDGNCLIDTDSKTLIAGCNGSTIPKDGSVIKLGLYAFGGCSFTDFVIPDGIAEIGDAVFNACYQLKEIVIPESVTKIGHSAFRLTNIEKIVLPKSIESIDFWAFDGSSITDVYYEGTESDKENISINMDNSALLSANWHYNTCTSDTHVYSGECDANCDNCDWIRISTTSHEYNSVQDMVCNNCGHPRRLDAIWVNTLPQKVEYLENKDSLDTTGGTIILYYNDDTVETIDMDEEMITGFDNTVVGIQTLVVSYGGFSTQYTIRVIPKELNIVEVTAKPTKLTYLEGEAFDKTGMVVTAYYNNNTSAIITDYTISGYSSTPGTKTITVSHGGKTATFTVTVNAKSLTSIVVTTKPTKLTYLEGESFDKTGMVVTAYYNNNTSAVITDYTISGYSSTPGTKTITVSYGGKTATFTVTVKSRVPDIITSSTYTISGGTVSKIPVETTVTDLLKNINENGYVKVYSGSQEVTENTLIGTGMVLKLMDGNTVKSSATIVVTGDTNGDGKITVTDMLAVKAHVLKKSTFSGASAQAADTSGDNGISITDFIQMKAQILGKSNVEPRSVNATAQQLSTASVEPEASVTTVTTEYTTSAADKTVSTLNYTQVVAVIPDKKSLVAL